MPESASIRAIDLFCCAGGSSWGAQSAGVTIVAGFDQWELAGRNFSANFADASFHLGRLEDLDPEEIAKDLGRIDLIIASPECTNHSPAKGDKPRSEQSKETAFQVVRFASVLRPRWIVIENVVSMRHWSRYKEFKGQLEDLGYNVREEVLNSSDFGVPQKRTRLFLVCDREAMPTRTPRRRGRKRGAASFVSMNGAYGWSRLRAKGRARATLKRARRAVRAVGSESPFLMVYYGSDGAGGWQRLSSPLRTVTTLDRFAVVKPSEKGHLMRMLQVPELQAAMGMEEMQLPCGTRRERIHMVGNAVCPPVMAEVVKHLTREANKDYDIKPRTN
jgi:DNA (cytosine-5)-methyltransferase 1